tara:strand:- start:89 stop:298 length:210 start_codon:yes stop_codon:yes gene_type:complete
MLLCINRGRSKIIDKSVNKGVYSDGIHNLKNSSLKIITIEIGTVANALKILCENAISFTKAGLLHVAYI